MDPEHHLKSTIKTFMIKDTFLTITGGRCGLKDSGPFSEVNKTLTQVDCVPPGSGAAAPAGNANNVTVPAPERSGDACLIEGLGS